MDESLEGLRLVLTFHPESQESISHVIKDHRQEAFFRVHVTCESGSNNNAVRVPADVF
jgi:hypothetical protein